MIREAIATLVEGRNLKEDEAAACMEEIMSGEATPAQFGAFVVALRLKGETVDEIVGMARVMREKALRVTIASESKSEGAALPWARASARERAG